MERINKPDMTRFACNEPMFADLIPDDGLLIKHLSENFRRTKEFLLALPESIQLHRYAAGKWTIKEVVIHLSDMERIYMYRALRFARNDQTELPGFNGDKYAFDSRANERTMESLVNELGAVRNATIATIDTFNEEELMRTGIANGATVSVNALIYHIAGHELHHLQVIRDKYLQ